MYEHRTAPLLPIRAFYLRLARQALIVFCILLTCLTAGMVGYHHFEAMGWTDSFVNAAMILSGMGPIGELKTEAGKIFAGCYALFSGVVFLTSVGLLLAPAFHRGLHKFHLAVEAAAAKNNKF